MPINTGDGGVFWEYQPPGRNERGGGKLLQNRCGCCIFASHTKISCTSALHPSWLDDSALDLHYHCIVIQTINHSSTCKKEQNIHQMNSRRTAPRRHSRTTSPTKWRMMTDNKRVRS